MPESTSANNFRTRTSIPAVCGITAPPLMVTLWTVASILRPGYSTGPNSIIMNLNFAVTGVLIIAFALGLVKDMHGSNLSRIGTTLLLVAGICEVVAAGFPCDPGCPAAAGSFSQSVFLAFPFLWIELMAIHMLSGITNR